MARLLFLFILISVGNFFRFIFLGVFDLKQILLLSMFPIGAALIFFIQKWLAKRDTTYIPLNEVKGEWNTTIYNRLAGRKMVYKGQKKVGEYKRFYFKWWQKIVNDVLEGNGTWYLNLSFISPDEEKIDIVETKNELFKAYQEWEVRRDGFIRGKIKTDYSIKNSVKLKEALILELGEESYYYQSYKIGSEIHVLQDGKVIASGKRSGFFSSTYHFHLQEEKEEHEVFLVLTYVLFHYVYK